jgi:uncharacterized membrane protein YkvA (DUF1232 family)
MTENNLIMEEKELNKSNGGAEVPVEYYADGELSDTETKELVEKVEEKAAISKGIKSFVRHLKALGRYLFDGNVAWYRRSVAAAALIYFLVPLDTIPDFAPFAGFLDDLGVITWTLRFLGKEIEGYY